MRAEGQVWRPEEGGRAVGQEGWCLWDPQKARPPPSSWARPAGDVGETLQVLVKAWLLLYKNPLFYGEMEGGYIQASLGERGQPGPALGWARGFASEAVDSSSRVVQWLGIRSHRKAL